MKTLQGVFCLMCMAFFTNCVDVPIDEVNIEGTGTVNVEPISDDETVTVAETDDATGTTTEAESVTDTTTAATETEETEETISTEGTPEVLVMDEEDVGQENKFGDGNEDAEPYENIYFDMCLFKSYEMDYEDAVLLDAIFNTDGVCDGYDSVYLVEANKIIAAGMSAELLNSKIIENEYYIITSFEYELASDLFEKVVRDSELNLDFCIIYRYYEFDCPDAEWEDVEFNSCQLTRMNDANLSDCLYQEIREEFE